ncbi:MAG: ABC transporter permease subunit [Planctomycetes bacterium]|nr:ABC transporter permease subunit [Planctomycetota bacterium]
MIRMPVVRAVFGKELLDLLRDRRTIFVSIFLPVILYPVVLLLFNEAFLFSMAKRGEAKLTVAVQPESQVAFVRSLADGTHPLLAEQKKLEEEAAKIEEASLTEEQKRTREKEKDEEKAQQASNPLALLRFDEAPLEIVYEPDPKAALEDRRIHALLILPPDFQAQMDASVSRLGLGEPPPQVKIEFDAAEQESRDAAMRVNALLSRYKGRLVDRVLAQRGLGRRVLDPFRVSEPQNIATAEKVGGSRFGSLVPLTFIIMIISGAIYPAIDLTAGEKERSTLETLMAMPVRPIEIITGKFLTVAALATTNALLNVLSFTCTFAVLGMGKTTALAFPWSAVPATIALLLPLTLLFAGLLLAVSSFAANFKEAQVYCLPVYLIPMLALLFVALPGLKPEGPLLVAPVVNTALLIKELFLAHEGLEKAFVFVFLSTILYAIVAVAFASRVFAREEVLFGAQGGMRLFLNRRYFKPTPTPRPGDGLLIVALLFPINFYLQAVLLLPMLNRGEEASPVNAALLLFLPQVLLVLLPLGVTWYLRARARDTFQWRVPPLRGMLSAALLSASSWVLMNQIVYLQIHYFWPLPELPKGPLEMAFESLGSMGWILFFIAVMPALCEEHLFRGLLFTSLGSERGKARAIVLSAALFAAFHFPLFRQPAVFAMGLMLGYLAWQTRSIWPGVLVHFFSNALSVSFSEDLVTMGPRGEPEPWIAPAYLLPALAAFAAGLWLLRGMDRDLAPAPVPAPSSGPAQAFAPESTAK